MKSEWRDGERTREVELTALGPGRWRVRVDESEFEVSAKTLPDGRLEIVSEGVPAVAEVTPVGARRFVRLGTLDFVLERERAGRRRAAGGSHHGSGLEAPMPGVVTRVMVAAGDEVARGQPLVALEAMKMEHLVRAPRAGRVERVAASPGQMVQAGAVLVELAEAAG
jgi:3-methylcrotonyl-CoA carboxylase alpha subunit